VHVPENLYFQHIIFYKVFRSFSQRFISINVELEQYYSIQYSVPQNIKKIKFSRTDSNVNRQT